MSICKRVKKEPSDSLPDHRPLLRWAGSKRKLIPQLLAHSPKCFNVYLEPFAGSACLFFKLRPSKAVLGDFNTNLIEMYRTVARSPRAVFLELEKYTISSDFYYELRARPTDSLSKVQAAAQFIYLNRFCFNGVYRTNMSGKFNVPFGAKPGRLPSFEELKAAACVLRSAELLGGDFERTTSKAAHGDFVYMDPPYSSSCYRGEYGYGAFSMVDVERLLDTVRKLDKRGVTFLVSYKADETISNRFSSWFQMTVSVDRNVAGFAGFRGKATELLISNRPFREGIL